MIYESDSEFIIFDRRTIEEREYWVNRLTRNLGAAGLVLDYPKGRLGRPETEAIDCKLPLDLVEKLFKLSRNSDFLIYTTLMAAIKVCLYKYTGSRMIVIGSPIRKAGDESFNVKNALAIVDDLDDNLTFQQLLLNVRQSLLDAYARQLYPFDRLIKDLSLEKSHNKCPLFDVALALSTMHGEMPEVNNDLTIRFAKESGSLGGKVSFNRNIFKPSTVTLFIRHYINILHAALERTTAQIRDLEMLTEAERRILIEWNDTRSDYSANQCIHHLFEAQVTKSPDTVAVSCGAEHLTYEQLNRRANQLAHYLVARGIGPETLVGICMERSLDLIVSLLGALKAGAAYAPLDPSYPKQRLAFMLGDARMPIVLTQSWFVADIEQGLTTIICLDQEQGSIATYGEESPTINTGGENLAYVVYTSGSTGKPKGVMIEHRAICNRLVWMRESYPLTESDRLLQKTPISFDASVWELFLPLMSGARLVIARPGGHRDSSYMVKAIADEEISVLQLVPTMLQVLLDERGVDSCKSLRSVYCGGEALPGEVEENYFARIGKELINLYGPTESSIDATSYHCVAGVKETTAPIGKPIDNMQIHILDRAGAPVAVGAPGEIHIGGTGLARGYHTRPGLTGERFIPNRFDSAPGERLYKTGDLGRYREDGNIEFLGRKDEQVKLRGYRIELGEIENAIAENDQVKRVVALVREDKPGDKRIVAYIEWKTETQTEVEELRQALKNKLPDYMLPAAIASIKQWPVGPNGKLDKGSLPAPEKNRSHVDQSYVAPRTPTEKMLAAIWGEILGMDQVGVHDNFFHFGGHSLLATQLVSRVREAFQVELPLERLFEDPTVAALSVAIVQNQAQQFEVDGMEEILRAVEELPEVEAESLLSDRNEWAADLKTT